MRVVGLVGFVVLTACSSAPIEDIDPIRPAHDTGQDTALDSEPDAEADTAAPEDARDAAIAEVEDDAAEDTTPDTIADTGVDTTPDAPPPVTWSTTFVVRPDPLGDTAEHWFVERAQLYSGDTVAGSRTLPDGPTWQTWSATIKVDRHQLTCPEAVARFLVRWNCVGVSCASDVVAFKVPRSTTTPSWSVTIGGTFVKGILDEPPKTAPGQPGPRVFLTLGQYGDEKGADCGRLDVYPSTVTFTGVP